jgi:hypothetical protein
VLGLPPAEASSISAFVQQFLHDVVTAVDPFGYYAEGIQQVRAGLMRALALLCVLGEERCCVAGPSTSIRAAARLP